MPSVGISSSVALRRRNCVHILRADYLLAVDWTRGLGMATRLPKGYLPTEDEPFMNAKMQEYFRRKLKAWREELVHESTQTLQHLQEDSIQEPDIADRASAESERALELRTRDRERKLLSKIDAALARIEDGTYGYCDELGEPINIQRLEARPIATLSIEAQERHEKRERVYRDE